LVERHRRPGANRYFLRLPLSSALQIVAVVGPTRTPVTACECRAERRAHPYGKASIFRAPSFQKNQIPDRRSARDKNRTKECAPKATADTRGLTTASNCRFGFVQQRRAIARLEGIAIFSERFLGFGGYDDHREID
jgi:hypothetical protein